MKILLVARLPYSFNFYTLHVAIKYFIKINEKPIIDCIRLVCTLHLNIILVNIFLFLIQRDIKKFT